MSDNSLTLQRKIPKQKRPQALVEDILTAAARVFVRDGLDGATTNRIAEVAGRERRLAVSVLPEQR